MTDPQRSDAETSDAEPSDAETSDAERSDAETSDAETSDAERSDAETTGPRTTGPDLELQAEELLTTTRSVRRRLDLDRPVDPALIFDSLRVALQAPNGADEQAWRFVVVLDPDRRARIADLYKRANREFAEGVRARAEAGDLGAARQLASSGVFWDHLARVPALVVAGFERQGWFDPGSAYARASAYGSVFPAVWNFQLACRLRGLGTCLVTSHLRYHEEVSALLELPASFEHAGMVAVGHLQGQRFSRAPRRPLQEVVRLDGWGEAPGPSEPR